jgi:hypothetical protein
MTLYILMINKYTWAPTWTHGVSSWEGFGFLIWL